MKSIKTSIAILTLLIAFSSCAQSDSTLVRKTCNNFIQGRINLRQDDSTLLKSVSSDSLFELIMLNHRYAKMLKAPIVRADLRIHVKSVEIKDNCASCLMSGYEAYTIKLCKEGNIWKVKGENDIYPTSARIQRARQKIVDYKVEQKKRPAVDSVLKVVNRFFKDIDVYFKTENLEPLRSTCNEPTLGFIEQLYTYAKERTGLELLHEEMDKPEFTVGDGLFEADRTLFKFYNEEIYIVLRKDNNEYIIHGFNKKESEDLSHAVMEANYLDLLRAMRLTRQAKYRSKKLN